MIMNKVGVKYLKHIIKNAFGKPGLRKLKITYVGDILIYSNLYYIGGFFIRITVKLSTYDATILFYNYYGNDHTYLKNKTVSSIDSVLSQQGKYYYSEYWDREFKLQDRIFAIPYKKEILDRYYDFIQLVKNNLNYGKTYYYGDGHNNSRFELQYENNSITIVQGDCEIRLEDLITHNRNEIVEKINSLRELNLEEVGFKIGRKRN